MAITLLKKRAIDQLSSDTTQSVGTSQTIYLRKTQGGRIIKTIRQQYLRDDLPCGSQSCIECLDYYDTPASGDPTTGGEQRSTKPILSLEGRPALSKSTNLRHYLVLDTNVILHQMDVVEASAFGKDVIILQTVIEEVRHRSLPLYNRLISLIGDESRRFYVFPNEARHDTYVVRQEGESPNDRNDRAIREATKWYNAHLAAAIGHAHRHDAKRRKTDVSKQDTDALAVAPIAAVLLSDDVGNVTQARQQGIKASSVRQYLHSMPSDRSTLLLDLLAASARDAEADVDADVAMNGKVESRSSKRPTLLFPEYLPTASLLAGIKAGRFQQGHYNPNPYNFLEATVNARGLSQPVLIIGRENQNRATPGDSVALEILPESEWKVSTDEVIEQEALAKNDNPEDSEDEGEDDSINKVEKDEEKQAKEKAAQSQGKKQPTGKIVGITKRNWRSYVCHLDQSSLGPSALQSIAPQNVFAIPVDRHFPKVRMRTRQTPTLVGQKFLVAVDRWDATSKYPSGHFVRLLGAVESKEAEIESLLLEFDVPYRPFPKAILDCLPPEGDAWVVPPKSESSAVWKGREDLRALDICSIDPIGCQDIDDALHARRLPNGNIEAGVHIADVSHFVKPDNPMDAEAASRGTTVYLVDKRIDMLPPLLGTNLCSLRPHVERLAFSVFWELDADANIVNVRFTKSVIASKAAFSYEEAQLRKDDPNANDIVTQGIRLLNEVAIKLKERRMQAGALNLASPEVKIHMDSSESSGPIDVEQKKLLETNSLVEEFMLLANISVAQRIYDQFPQTAVLRRHLPPPATNFEALKEVLKKRKGFDLDTSSSGALAKSLDQCEDPEIPAFNTLVRIMATRCMLPAEYFCSGSVAKDTFGHYGLASTIYTHFTSPIRRYADVLAHRELYAAISNTPLHSALHSTAFVDRIMDNINKRHRLAQHAGRASVEFYVSLALRSRKEVAAKAGQQSTILEDAFVIRAFKNGIAVFVSSLGLEGLITFKGDYTYDAEEYELNFTKQNKQYKIAVFDKVQVEVTVEKDKSTQRGRVVMHLVSPFDSRNL